MYENFLRNRLPERTTRPLPPPLLPSSRELFTDKTSNRVLRNSFYNATYSQLYINSNLFRITLFFSLFFFSLFLYFLKFSFFFFRKIPTPHERPPEPCGTKRNKLRFDWTGKRTGLKEFSNCSWFHVEWKLNWISGERRAPLLIEMQRGG